MRKWIAGSALVIFLGAALSPASAQTDGSAYMIHMMASSTSFRVRAQAALRLGDMTASSSITTALVGALRDADPSVRAAASQSLGRVGDSTALTALRGLSRDPEPTVVAAASAAVTAISGRGAPPSGAGTGGTAPPSGPARYYIGVGEPGSTVAGIDRSLLTSARATVVTAITPMSGFVVAPAGETVAAARTAIHARSLTGFYLDVSITDLVTRPDGSIHTAVSIVVQDYPSHNIRSMLSGNATASGISGVSGQRAVIQAAITGALRGLPTAMGVH